jgi:hypothetical protein
MLYFWLLDLCATCARESSDFRPYESVEDLLSGIGATHGSMTARILALLAVGYGLKALP